MLIEVVTVTQALVEVLSAQQKRFPREETAAALSSAIELYTRPPMFSEVRFLFVT
jgi:hypothetical protein